MSFNVHQLAHMAISPSFTPDQLHVIAVINNPIRFNSRIRLFRDFELRMKAAGVHLVVVEATFNERNFEVTQYGNPDHVQIVQKDELWLKENLVNIGVTRLPLDWKYMAWIDADVEFLRPDWAVETIHQLQHYAIVQMFQTACDTGPVGEVFNVYNGFGYSFVNGLPKWTVGSCPYYGQGGKYWHPGYAWAMTRTAFDQLGGLLDIAILGAGDHHMALAHIGEAVHSVPEGLHPNYLKHVLQWQERSTTHIRQNFGYVPGTLIHYWHGKKGDRQYWDRWSIAKQWQYDPEKDIKKDAQGLTIFSDQGLRMRNDIRNYARSRNEDSIDFE